MTEPVSPPRLSAVVVHWRDEASVRELVAAWPDDPRCELLVVDNSSTLSELPPPARLLDPGCNLGFAGGVNRGVEAARGEWVLLLNPDVRPEDGSVETVLESLEELDPAGLVPALVDGDGEPQTRWQLRPLPSPFGLLLQTLFLSGVHGPRNEPERGTAIAQPAGAALAVRTSILRRMGGLDEGYHPAWFEDVDLAARLARDGHRLLYEPLARFRHAIGGSLPALGYGRFLWIYYRNLTRYLERHHGRGWSLAAHLTLPVGMTLRLLLLPLRRPHRAATRRDAAVGLLAVVAGAVSGWRRPRGWAERFSRRPEGKSS